MFARRFANLQPKLTTYRNIRAPLVFYLSDGRNLCRLAVEFCLPQP
jgi:hypothetical protein